MARIPRILVKGEDAIYHVISRKVTGDRNSILDIGRKLE